MKFMDSFSIFILVLVLLLLEKQLFYTAYYLIKLVREGVEETMADFWAAFHLMALVMTLILVKITNG